MKFTLIAIALTSISFLSKGQTKLNTVNKHKTKKVYIKKGSVKISFVNNKSNVVNVININQIDSVVNNNGLIVIYKNITYIKGFSSESILHKDTLTYNEAKRYIDAKSSAEIKNKLLLKFKSYKLDNLKLIGFSYN
jgi:hypothetical protein